MEVNWLTNCLDKIIFKLIERRSWMYSIKIGSSQFPLERSMHFTVQWTCFAQSLYCSLIYTIIITIKIDKKKIIFIQNYYEVNGRKIIVTYCFIFPKHRSRVKYIYKSHTLNPDRDAKCRTRSHSPNTKHVATWFRFIRFSFHKKKRKQHFSSPSNKLIRK